MCDNCNGTHFGPADLLTELEQTVLLAEMEQLVMAKEVEHGLSIPDAVRPLTENEVNAQVHFGDIMALQDEATAEAEAILANLREVLVAEIMKALPETELAEARFAQGSTASALLSLSQNTPKPVAEAIDTAGADLTAVFNRVYRGSIGIVGDEISRQGIRVAEGLAGLNGPGSLLDAQGYASALQHWNRLTSKLVENHATPAAILGGKTGRASVMETIEKVSTAGALDTARQGIHTAHGAARVDAADMQGCSDIWASELLDGRTCDLCKEVDGKDYTSMAAAKLDYPAGGYSKCEGGARCRGTLVFMYLDPQPVSGIDPDGNVTGRVDLPTGPQPPRPSIVDEWPTATDTPKRAPGTLAEQVKAAVETVDTSLGGSSLEEVFKGAGVYADASDPGTLEKRAVWDNLHRDFAQAVSDVLPDGYRMEAQLGFEVKITDNYSAQAGYWFYDKDGDHIGRATRDYTLDGKKASVEHAYFELNRSAQGHGISTRFLAASEEFYRKLGIEQITIHANIDVGGYAWARAGFDWRNAGTANLLVEERGHMIGRYINDPAKMQEFTELLQRLQAVTKENLLVDAITPFEVAMWGYTPGATEWIGKTFLLDADWYGRKML